MIDRRGRSMTLTEFWRRRFGLVVVLLVIGMAALATIVDTTVPYFSGSDGASSVPIGLFVGSQAPADVLTLGKQLGVTPTIDTVYADGSCYCTYTPPSTSMTLMLGVGALTSSEATSIGQSLVDAGQSDAIIRIMWEQNQDIQGWFQNWNQLSFSATQYISTFRGIVTTMRAVPGQAFRFMWNPNGGTGNEASGRTWNDTWPGSAYVNYVGVDQYDYSGYAANVEAVIAFAQSQGDPAAIPEWGLNGSDDPSYINGMAALINGPSNNIALQAYFSYDGGSGGIDSDITEFPQSEAAFTVDFGGSTATLPPPTTTPPTTSPPTTISPPTTTSPTTTPTTTAPPPATTSTTEPPTTTPSTTIPPTTTPPTTSPPTSSPPTTTPPTTTSTPVTTSTTVSVLPEVGTAAQGLTATVSPAPAGGTVQFIVDGWVVGDAIPLSSNGTAVMALYLSDGQHLVDATYSGDPLFDESDVSTVVGVGQAPTALVAAAPTRIGPDQLYQLNATLNSEGVPLAGAPVWFSGAGSALCVATTDASGQASCSIDEGASDVFSLSTSGDSAAYGGDATHLPSWGQSPSSGNGSGAVDNADATNVDHGSGQVAHPASSPVTPASAAATDTPADLDATILRGSTSGGTGGPFVVVGLAGLALVGVATLGRRRLLRRALRAHPRWPQS